MPNQSCAYRHKMPWTTVTEIMATCNSLQQM